MTFQSKYTPGQQVTIKPLNVRGWVWSVVFSPGVVTYDCHWWFNGERKSSILTEDEIDV